MDLMQGRPFTGRTLERLKKFLASVGLLYDDGVEMSVCACDDDGEIKVTLHQKGKGVKIAVSNNYAEGKDVDYTRFLDRFYREDQSHNIDKGGFGIGLSIADSIVRQYRGKLDVSYQDGVIEFSAVLKP